MPDQPEAPPNTVTLVDQRGTRTLHIAAEVLASGDLQISGHDLSPDLKEVFGEQADEYEYWLTVPKEQKDRVLLALLVRFYGGRPEGDTELEALLKEQGIPYKFDNYV